MRFTFFASGISTTSSMTARAATAAGTGTATGDAAAKMFPACPRVARSRIAADATRAASAFERPSAVRSSCVGGGIAREASAVAFAVGVAAAKMSDVPSLARRVISEMPLSPPTPAAVLVAFSFSGR